MSCKGFVFVIEGPNGLEEIEPPQLLDFNPENLPSRLPKNIDGSHRMSWRRSLQSGCDDGAEIA